MHVNVPRPNPRDTCPLIASRGDRMANEIEVHTERWMAELQLASRAAHPEAAKAHLGLSTLHFQRMLDLQRRTAGPGRV